LIHDQAYKSTILWIKQINFCFHHLWSAFICSDQTLSYIIGRCAIDDRDRSSSLSDCIKVYDAFALASYSLKVLWTSVIITKCGFNKFSCNYFGHSTSLWSKEERHLNFLNRKVKTIKLEWTINRSIGHMCVAKIVISKNRISLWWLNKISKAPISDTN